MEENKKDNYKIGTLSLKIILILFFLLLGISLFTNMETVKFFIPSWPIMPMILAGEIFWHNTKKKENKVNIIALFVIFILIALGMFLHYLITTDVGSDLISQFGRKRYGFNRSDSYIIEDIDRIVIQGDSISNMTVEISDVGQVSYSENISIRAEDLVEANESFRNNRALSFNKIGSKLYINQTDIGGAFDDYSLVRLKIPSSKEVDIIDGRYLNLSILDLSKALNIRGFEELKIKIRDRLSIDLRAYPRSRTNLRGNVIWNIRGREKDEYKPLEARTQIGDGQTPIRILDIDGDIRVDKL